MKTSVYMTFDNNGHTWNVMSGSLDKDLFCHHFGTPDSCKEWIASHSDEYEEEPRSASKLTLNDYFTEAELLELEGE